MLRRVLTSFALIALSAVAVVSVAQDDAPPAGGPKFGILQGLGGGFGGPSADENVKLRGSFTVQEGGQRGLLSLEAKIAKGWHVYSVSQPDGGPGASKIKVPKNAQFKLLGPFQPDRDPVVKPPDVFKVPSEEHTGQVTWTAPIELAEGVKPEGLSLQLTYDGQVCSESTCIPIQSRSVDATFAGYTKAPESAGVYRPAPQAARLVLTGKLEPAVVAPGGTVRVSITATTEPGWHVYAYADEAAAEAEAGANKPTLITLSGIGGGEVGQVTESNKPIEKPAADGLPAQKYYEQPVTWTVDLKVPADAQLGEYLLSGNIGFQTCKDKQCLPPSAAKFTASVPIASVMSSGEISLNFEEAKYADVATQAAELAAARAAASPAKRAINWTALMPVLGLAALGGLILNLMPCVLPVLGLKILSFAKQGGESRAKVIMLNLAYTAGLMSVFLVLAALVAFTSMGWGEQFTHVWFRVAVTALVFVMALSFLGVWELPIPGFATSDTAGTLQQTEGVQGAFFKGMFTTVIATPCSGPFLGSVLGLTLDQPPLAIFLIFGAAGLGMAAPYLLVGMFPALSRVIPKPGAWMETFERVLGFLMLVAAVIQFSTIGSEYFVASLLLMVGLAFACWLIGRVPEYADRWRIINTWVIGGCAAAMIGFIAFSYFGPPNAEEELPWQPFSRQTLAQLQSEGKTVLVDFTADWCLTCQYNSRLAINTPKVQELVSKNGVVPLLADWTNPSPEIKSQLTALRSASIPVLAIYPAGRPGEVIILRDTLVESQVLKALEEAGPSAAAADASETARLENAAALEPAM
jgi:suppressor for copper-sensitivity B